ncbi:cyclin-dependent kinase 9 [Caerostris extrusa]|uniref:cyclin-dependent kinase n=1 Tax=Caerostris extrusa TaxID=172846 RepID=A0AAV4TNS1_CAEEX|nr:cyclin-dependent kinase 9 [Caerostris extrusa]
MVKSQSVSPEKEKKSQKKENIRYPFCDDVIKYEKLMKIAQGTFGEVFKAEHRVTKKIVALKKIKKGSVNEGFPITVLREIKILKFMKHKNMVHLIEVCRSEGDPIKRILPSFYLVFEFCDHDLSGLINNTDVTFTLGSIKMVMQQLLNGLFFLHAHHIMHRYPTTKADAYKSAV